MPDQENHSRRSTEQIGGSGYRGYPHLFTGADGVLTRGQTLQGLISDRSHSNSISMGRGFMLSNDLEHGAADNSDDEGLTTLTRRQSHFGAEALVTPQMRSMRLIGNSNPRYRWEKYIQDDEQLKKYKKPVRKYYERNNDLVAQYLYIDRLLDSSLPHNLIQEYNRPGVPGTIAEEESPAVTPSPLDSPHLLGQQSGQENGQQNGGVKLKRTPRTLYRVPTEDTPLLGQAAIDDEDEEATKYHAPMPEEDVDSDSPIVSVAITINFSANGILLLLKIAAAVMTSSLSVLASLVDAALDFLSTAIVWATSKLISHSAKDPYGYPAGRRRLEPIGVLVFSVIMITSFVQVFIQAITRLTSGSTEVVELTIPAIAIMGTTVVIKLACWFWCRLVRNSSVQALAEDAMTDVVFNTFSIIFPLLGFWLRIWWLDPLGGLVLSLYVIINWARVSAQHIRNLSGAAADADRRNVLLYLTMRFAKTIKQIQGMTAYHAGDKLICEVDIILDEATQLRDSHDLGESLQYVLESVPFVDRAFVHMDYRSDNLPTHMDQRE